jgi:hypothetical protein
VVKVPLDGSAGAEALFSLPGNDSVNYLDAGRDGSIYLDTWHRPSVLLRFGEVGGDPQLTLVPDLVVADLGVLPGGKFLFPGNIAGKSRLLANTAAGDWRPFVQTAEETSDPFTVSSGGSMAFVIGTPPRRQIAIASARDGRVLQRVSLDAADVGGLALSPDGRTLYYAAGGAIWSLALTGSAKAKRIIEGNQLCIDHAGHFLYVKQLAKDPALLVRVPVGGGAAVTIPIPQELRLTVDNLAANAVDERGRVLMEVASADSFFFAAALFDPARNSVTRIPTHFEGDIWSPTWSADGRIASLGASFASSMWRFHPVKH